MPCCSPSPDRRGSMSPKSASCRRSIRRGAEPMRSAECEVRSFNEGSFATRRFPLHFALHIPHSALVPMLIFLGAPSLADAQQLPPLPDTTGFGVHVLALARAPANAIWVGTYGQGILVLRQGARSGEPLKHAADTAAHCISGAFVRAFGVG